MQFSNRKIYGLKPYIDFKGDRRLKRVKSYENCNSFFWILNKYSKIELFSEIRTWLSSSSKENNFKSLRWLKNRKIENENNLLAISNNLNKKLPYLYKKYRLLNNFYYLLEENDLTNILDFVTKMYNKIKLFRIKTTSSYDELAFRKVVKKIYAKWKIEVLEKHLPKF